MNKNTLIRLLSAALCVVMAMATLGACGKQEEGGKSDGDKIAQGDLGEVKSALKFEPKADLDLKGKTLKIADWGTPTPEGQDEFYDRRYIRERRTEEKYNVNIEFISTNTNTVTRDIITAFTAGKSFADLIYHPSNLAFGLCKAGVVLPLDDYIDYGNDWYKFTGDNLRYIDGKHYSYMPDEYSVNATGYFITYNQTLIEKAGCEYPIDLYNEGKWDWDAFTDIAKKTTIIENGETVQWGVGGTQLLEGLCLSNGFSAINMNLENKKFECDLYTDAGRNVLNKLRELAYTNKSVDGNYGSDNSGINFTDSKLAMMVCQTYHTRQMVTEGMPIGTVPLPKGPDAKNSVNGLGLVDWWMVSANSEFDTKDLIQVALDMNENDPAYPETYFDEEGRKDEYLIRVYDSNCFATEEEGEFFFDYFTSSDVDTILNISDYDISEVMKEKIYQPIYEGEDPRTVLDSQKNVIDTALKNMLPDKLK